MRRGRKKPKEALRTLWKVLVQNRGDADLWEISEAHQRFETLNSALTHIQTTGQEYGEVSSTLLHSAS